MPTRRDLIASITSIRACGDEYYVYYEADRASKILKYELRLVLDWTEPVTPWPVHTNYVVLFPGMVRPAQLWLSYTGEPETIEKIKFEPTFYAFDWAPLD